MNVSFAAPARRHEIHGLKKMRVVTELQGSELFLSYQKVFQDVTGLPLELHAVDDEVFTACRGSVNQNRFCHLLNQGDSGCRECLLAQACLADSEGKNVQSISCFAGLQETAIPVMAGSVLMAQLKTGQIVFEKPQKDDFDRLMRALEGGEFDRAELAEAYGKTQVISRERYQGMVTLLAAFSLQLTVLANQIAHELEGETNDPIEAAKDYIELNFTEAIHLDEVAESIGISSFHFCRKFKEATGKTLTQFVAQRRVEMAKELLETTQERVTDIAFKVGFQSLSQFNRSFARATGMNPVSYRRMAA